MNHPDAAHEPEHGQSPETSAAAASNETSAAAPPREAAAIAAWRLFPLPAARVAPGEIYAAESWPLPPPGRPYVVINMVGSVDGRAALDGSSAGLGSRLDRQLLRRLRGHADALLVGAGTLRAEAFAPTVPAAAEAVRLSRGLARQPLGVVASGAGQVPPVERWFGQDPDRRLIVTTASGAKVLPEGLVGRAGVAIAGAETLDLPLALHRLRVDHGVRWLLCEGGPSLNASLLQAGLVDELYLTVAPKLLARDGPPIVATADPPLAPQPLTLVSIYTADSELYLRYRVGASTPPPPVALQ